MLTGRLPAFRQNKFAAAVKRDGEFDRLLSSATPHLWGTYTLMAINILFFALMLIQGGSGVLWNPPHNLVLGFGANFGPYTFGQGQWWRLLSCQFIHIGIILLSLSMFFLWWFGRIAERLIREHGFYFDLSLRGDDRCNTYALGQQHRHCRRFV